jgi:nucleoside-diphosphate-sugar epimerase
MKKILLLGGAGYIGNRLSRRLLELDYDVTVIDGLWFGNNLPAAVKLIQKDIFELKTDDYKGFDSVVFLGGVSNDPMAEFNPAENFVQNAAAPSFAGFLAKAAGVKKFVYASSCSVYGFANEKFFTEEDEISCAYPYGISKLQGEQGVLSIADDNFNVISLRQGTVCGFSERMRFDLVINSMFKDAITKKIIYISNPNIWRPILHIEDTCSAFIRAIQVTGVKKEIFNIATENIVLGQLAEIVKIEVEKLAGINVLIEDRNIQDYRNYRVSIEKAYRILGYKPTHTLVDVVKNIYENLDKISDFEKEEYYNIRVFKTLGK